ncbi:MAG: hypothetical protein ACRD0Q_04225 [Acidimicrobiales bacterium]
MSDPEEPSTDLSAQVGESDPNRREKSEDAGIDDLDDFDDFDVDDFSPWAGLAASIGTGLIAVVAVQVLLAVVEGFTLHSGERAGVADDLFHRLGYPFDGLGTIALFLLITGVIVVSLPSIVGEELAPGHDRMVSVALVVSAVLAVVIALGSILAVRANLHVTVAQYSANQRSIPSFVRVRLASFLLGSLGAAALALFGSLAARGHRAAERWEG